jgi:hypothetical protein
MMIRDAKSLTLLAISSKYYRLSSDPLPKTSKIYELSGLVKLLIKPMKTKMV